MAWYKFWENSNNENNVKNTNSGSYIPHNVHTSRNVIYSAAYDGEKTPGELGSIFDLKPEHLKLRLRAYELDLKTDLVKIITGKFFNWAVGTGLKIQVEPENDVLGFLKYKKVENEEKNNRERLFNLWAKSKISDYVGRDNLHKKASETFKTAFLGGDVLIVLRVSAKKGLSVQIIDGEQVSTPSDESGKGKNNHIINGVEVNKRGEHIAFWVKSKGVNLEAKLKHKRVKAKDSNGFNRAWLAYGSKHRIDHHRGIPKISSILEKISKLDRYVEASVSKAEKMADLVYAFEHEDFSTGENPLGGLAAKKTKDLTTEIDSFEESGRTAQQLRQSTSGEVLNLPKGAKLKALANEAETNFDEFYRAVFRSLCAAVDVPPEVAIQMYEQSYSSSRAAINMWEHIIEIYREYIIVDNFYKPIYKFWTYYNSLKDVITNDGYEKALSDDNEMALEAYYSCRFIGKKMPHIDPLKEAKAIRSLLGNQDPLISREQATEMSNSGDWNSNYSKYKEESEQIEPEKIRNQSEINANQNISN